MKKVGKVKYRGWNCDVLMSEYMDNGAPALVLQDADDFEPVATATVNICKTPPEGHVFIKDYAENQGLLKALVDGGIVKDTGQRVQQGYVVVAVAKLLVG